MHINSLKLTELKDIAKKLQFKNVGDKSGEMLRKEIKHLVKNFLAGQGECHQYTSVRGRTAGWTDGFCPHGFKLGAKKQPAQESVGDASDLLRSFPKYPMCHLCDDACNYVR